MINGEGVMSKYNVIVAGRRSELYAGLAYSERDSKRGELLTFLDDVRRCNREEFETWYELYKD